MKNYRVTPFFILAFLSASIILAFFIHRARTDVPVHGNFDPSISEEQRMPASTRTLNGESSLEKIEEIPKDWIRE